MTKFLIAASLLIGGYVWMLWGIKRMHAEEKERSKSPFTRKMLRPAGESLRLRIDVIRDQIDEAGMVLGLYAIFPVITVVALDFTRNNLGTFILVGMLSVVYLSINWGKIRKLRKELRNHRLGYDGERYVAAELNGLMREGWMVYHDFIVDDRPGGEVTNYNIDHIAVSNRGVFVFETKAIRKPLQGLRDGEENHRVKVEGGKLFLPKRIVNGEPIRQAERNAKWVSDWLTGSGAKRIPVIPVVVIPGWFIEGEKEGTQVLNEKRLLSILPGLGTEGVLIDAEVAAISDRIEEKCRNVEGAA